ncbi:F-box protein, partial [Vibrio parahaemolyticus]|uniref:F-box protein n=1 Tax=Vibrio parahaemolyticus TaxID=670 RepID=UPI0034E07350
NALPFEIYELISQYLIHEPRDVVRFCQVCKRIREMQQNLWQLVSYWPFATYCCDEFNIASPSLAFFKYFDSRCSRKIFLAT